MWLKSEGQEADVNVRNVPYFTFALKDGNVYHQPRQAIVSIAKGNKEEYMTANRYDVNLGITIPVIQQVKESILGEVIGRVAEVAKHPKFQDKSERRQHRIIQGIVDKVIESKRQEAVDTIREKLEKMKLEDDRYESDVEGAFKVISVFESTKFVNIALDALASREER